MFLKLVIVGSWWWKSFQKLDCWYDFLEILIVQWLMMIVLKPLNVVLLNLNVDEMYAFVGFCCWRFGDDDFWNFDLLVVFLFWNLFEKWKLVNGERCRLCCAVLLQWLCCWAVNRFLSILVVLVVVLAGLLCLCKFSVLQACLLVHRVLWFLAVGLLKC